MWFMCLKHFSTPGGAPGVQMVLSTKVEGPKIFLQELVENTLRGHLSDRLLDHTNLCP